MHPLSFNFFRASFSALINSVKGDMQANEAQPVEPHVKFFTASLAFR
jgi:hypothetical protein